jgi:hypothetical protein
MAGTESTANTMSVISRKRRATNKGVACHLPSTRKKNLWPCISVVTGTRRRNWRMMALLSGSTSLSSVNIILKPV